MPSLIIEINCQSHESSLWELPMILSSFPLQHTSYLHDCNIKEYDHNYMSGSDDMKSWGPVQSEGGDMDYEVTSVIVSLWSCWISRNSEWMRTLLLLWYGNCMSLLWWMLHTSLDFPMSVINYAWTSHPQTRHFISSCIIPTNIYHFFLLCEHWNTHAHHADINKDVVAAHHTSMRLSFIYHISLWLHASSKAQVYVGIMDEGWFYCNPVDICAHYCVLFSGSLLPYYFHCLHNSLSWSSLWYLTLVTRENLVISLKRLMNSYTHITFLLPRSHYWKCAHCGRGFHQSSTRVSQ